MPRKVTTEDFIRKSISIHGNKYDYSKSVCNGVHNKICIICPKHGEFLQTPSDHISGKGCPKCAIENTRNRLLKTTDEFIKKAKQNYGDKYSYAKTEYKGKDKKVIIGCKTHGDFKVIPYYHLQGRGCPLCTQEKISADRRLDTEELVRRFNIVHNSKYDYSKVVYTNNHTDVTIICPIHGEFKQRPEHHLYGSGCPQCSRTKSHLEMEIKNSLDNLIINYAEQYPLDKKRKSDTLLVDFYLPDYSAAIECQGIQHFQPVKQFGGEDAFIKTQERDKRKLQKCQEQNIKLFYFTHLKQYETFLGNPLFKDFDVLINEIKIKYGIVGCSNMCGIKNNN